jgi:hypothetical protein
LTLSPATYQKLWLHYQQSTAQQQMRFNDRARSFADKRTRIAANYFQHSDFAVQMYSGADWYITYGFVPFIIELDEESKTATHPHRKPIGAYPEFDRYGRCVAFAKRYMMTLGELVTQFPEYDSMLARWTNGLQARP